MKSSSKYSAIRRACKNGIANTALAAHEVLPSIATIRCVAIVGGLALAIPDVALAEFVGEASANEAGNEILSWGMWLYRLSIITAVLWIGYKACWQTRDFSFTKIGGLIVSIALFLGIPEFVDWTGEKQSEVSLD